MQFPIYVFFSPDRQICGLTIDRDCANLVHAAPKLEWRYSDQVAPAINAVGMYVRFPHLAIKTVAAHGFYVERVRAQIIPFHRRPKSSQ